VTNADQSGTLDCKAIRATKSRSHPLGASVASLPEMLAKHRFGNPQGALRDA